MRPGGIPENTSGHLSLYPDLTRLSNQELRAYIDQLSYYIDSVTNLQKEVVSHVGQLAGTEDGP